MGFIYKITNTENDKIYIGKTTKSIEERFTKHLYASQYYHKTKLYAAINKYGIDKFKIELLEECNDDELSHKEIFWISELDTFVNGYNMTLGGDGMDSSIVDNENFKLAMKKYHDNKPKEEYATYGFEGHTHSNETKTLQSKKRKSAWENPNSKYHCRPDITGKNNPMYGKTPKNAIKVVIGGVEYKSISHAVRELKISTNRVKELAHIN